MNKGDTKNSSEESIQFVRTINLIGALIFGLLAFVEGLAHIAAYFLLIYIWIYICFFYSETRNFNQTKTSLIKYLSTNIFATISGVTPILIILILRSRN